MTNRDVETACVKVKSEIQVFQNKKQGLYRNNDRELMKIFEGTKRNRFDEEIRLKNIVQICKLIQGCKIIHSYANELKFSAAPIANNLRNPVKLEPWLPKIYSIFYAQQATNLQYLNDFKKMFSVGLDLSQAAFDKYVDKDVKWAFNTVVDEQQIKVQVNDYVNQLIQRSKGKLTLQIINSAGHQFKPNVPPNNGQLPPPNTGIQPSYPANYIGGQNYPGNNIGGQIHSQNAMNNQFPISNVPQQEQNNPYAEVMSPNNLNKIPNPYNQSYNTPQSQNPYNQSYNSPQSQNPYNQSFNNGQPQNPYNQSFNNGQSQNPYNQSINNGQPQNPYNQSLNTPQSQNPYNQNFSNEFDPKIVVPSKVQQNQNGQNRFIQTPFPVLSNVMNEKKEENPYSTVDLPEQIPQNGQRSGIPEYSNPYLDVTPIGKLAATNLMTSTPGDQLVSTKLHIPGAPVSNGKSIVSGGDGYPSIPSISLPGSEQYMNSFLNQAHKSPLVSSGQQFKLTKQFYELLNSAM